MEKELHELSKMYLGAEERLLEYVRNNDVEGIIDLVRKEGTKLLEKNIDNFRKPILHIACDDLAQSTTPRTIKTLIDQGADMYAAIQGGYEAIHSAIRGQNPNIVKAIVDKIGHNPEKLNATAEGQTALYILAKSEDTDTVHSKECLRVILEAGIDVNIPNNKMISPILWAAFKGRKNVVKAILECGRDVTIDSPTYREKTARAYIVEKNLYDGILPVQTFDSNKNMGLAPTVYLIRSKNEEKFLELKDVDVNEETDEGTLLQLACQYRLCKIVQYLLHHDADVYKTTEKNKTLPLQIAAKHGFYKIFDLLIGKHQKLPEGILTTLLANMNLNRNNDVDYQKCLLTLLERDDVPVNEYSDTRNTPLHYSGLVTNPQITLKLLAKGASLANENKYKSLPVEEIDPKILEQHFDNCVTLKKFVSTDKRKTVVNFDYSSLIPTVTTQKNENTDVEAALLEDPVREHVSETGVINIISKTPEMRHLLVHPLISSFILVKWHRMCWFFMLNLMLFLLFSFAFFAHVFIPNEETIQDQYKIPINLVWAILILTYCMLILREASQLFLSPRTYCCSWSNVLEILMLGISAYPIISKPGTLLHKQLSSIALVFIALELMVLLAQHPSLSTYMVMLRTVAKNFFYFLAWYAILIFAFVLSFYNLFNTNGTNNASNETISENEGEEKEQEFFNDLGLTFVKTIVMLTGEFDAGSINFKSFLTRVIFLLFVFMITIILFNLLNGLAVSDTQQIKSEAELVGYAERVSYIVYMEGIILGNAISPNAGCLFANCRHCWAYRLTPQSLISRISLIPYLSQKKLDILVYHRGLIIKDDVIPPEECINDYTAARVDDKTVKRVKHILIERSRESERSQEVKHLHKLIGYQDEIIERYKDEITKLRRDVERINAN